MFAQWRHSTTHKRTPYSKATTTTPSPCDDYVTSASTKYARWEWVGAPFEHGTRRKGLCARIESGPSPSKSIVVDVFACVSSFHKDKPNYKVIIYVIRFVYAFDLFRWTCAPTEVRIFTCTYSISDGGRPAAYRNGKSSRHINVTITSREHIGKLCPHVAGPLFYNRLRVDGQSLPHTIWSEQSNAEPVQNVCRVRICCGLIWDAWADSNWN